MTAKTAQGGRSVSIIILIHVHIHSKDTHTHTNARACHTLFRIATCIFRVGAPTTFAIHIQLKLRTETGKTLRHNAFPLTHKCTYVCMHVCVRFSFPKS